MKDIQKNAVVYTDAEGNDVTIKSDSVVWQWVAPENSLAKVLEDSGFNVTTIGDANRYGKLVTPLMMGSLWRVGFDN